MYWEAGEGESLSEERLPLPLSGFLPPFPKDFDFIESLIEGGGFRECFFEKTRGIPLDALLRYGVSRLRERNDRNMQPLACG